MKHRRLLGLVLVLCGITIFLSRVNNRTNSKRPELNNKRQDSSEAKTHTLNNVAGVTISKLKVLVLAYGRTGSSLTGDLISADTTSAYFFEPFWNRSALTTTNSTEGILNGLFDCSPELISEITALQWPHSWPYISVRRPGQCQTSILRVVKTIRVRKEDLDSWIGKSDIKARSDGNE